MATRAEVEAERERSSQAFWRALDAANRAEEATAAAKRAAYEHPSHEGLDTLEAAERAERTAMDAFKVIAKRDERINRMLLQSSGRMPATDAEARLAHCQIEAFEASEEV